MFKRAAREKTALEEAITVLHSEMAGHEGDSDEFAKMTDQLTKLYKLREFDTPQHLVKPDTLILAATNLLGIAMIVGHERTHVVTSKALNFVKTLR